MTAAPSKLPRVKFTHASTSELDGERASLAKQAQSVLGYGKLAQALCQQDSLSYALRKLGIEPLVPSSVEIYKARKTRPGMWSGKKIGMAYVASALTGASVVARIMESINWAGPTVANILTIAGLAVMAIILIAGLICLLDSSYRGSRKTYSWRLLDIGSYAGNIPEFALDKAVRIKQECPEVTLMIELLYENTEHAPTRDPFLVANLGGETFYIDVWDEKEYEAVL
jgi:hypothetical protein